MGGFYPVRNNIPLFAVWVITWNNSRGLFRSPREFLTGFYMPKMLKNNFFNKPTLEVARNLLGKILVRKYRGKLIKGAVTETEAYFGHNDRASHASRGRTKRNKVMFNDAGRIYVYLIYGMHYCLNIVTEKKEFPAAVLIRGVKVGNLNLAGPGKVTKYFHIDKALNKKPLGQISGLWIEEGIGAKKLKIKSGPRIGVDYAGPWADRLWRFYLT